MRPLVYYCRWQRARLRLYGRDKKSVWGELAYTDPEKAGQSQTFRFELEARRLTLFDSTQRPTTILLDEMGVVIPNAGGAPQ